MKQFGTLVLLFTLVILTHRVLIANVPPYEGVT